MKPKTIKNRDIILLNIISIIVLILSAALAYFIWNGYITFLDGPMGMRRECIEDQTWFKLMILFALAGAIELMMWKLIKALYS